LSVKLSEPPFALPRQGKTSHDPNEQFLYQVFAIVFTSTAVALEMVRA